jgi:hypothetical protein
VSKRARLLLATAIGLAACGSDDQQGRDPPPKCLADAKLSGGVNVDASLEYECGDGLSTTTTAAHVTIELRLPGDEPGYLGLRMFGLQGTTDPGTKLGAGVEVQPGIPPGPLWSAGFDSGSACQATIEAQAPQPGLELVLVTANVACNEPLVSTADGAAPVSVERLRARALYVP